MMHSNVKYPKLHNEGWLRERYVVDEMTDEQIANVVGCAQSTVSNARENHGIETDRSRWGKISELGRELSQSELQLIEGEILGDASIVRPSDSNGARFSYSTKYETYRDWLAEKLRKMGFEVRTDRVDGKKTAKYRLRTLAYDVTTILRNEWYGDDGKRIRSGFELSPISLRQWYIGDGSIRDSGAILYNYAFTGHEKSVLSKQLSERGIENTVTNEGFYIKVESRERFFGYMKNLPDSVRPIYGYKWGI